jgi:hypothetical protein
MIVSTRFVGGEAVEYENISTVARIAVAWIQAEL